MRFLNQFRRSPYYPLYHLLMVSLLILMQHFLPCLNCNAHACVATIPPLKCTHMSLTLYWISSPHRMRDIIDAETTNATNATEVCVDMSADHDAVSKMLWLALYWNHIGHVAVASQHACFLLVRLKVLNFSLFGPLLFLYWLSVISQYCTV